jgi:hypothetical protein
MAAKMGNFGYKNGMPKKPGRPRKKLADRKTVDLRIPVTAGQKELIYAALAGDEFARWAREVLMRAAAERQRDSPAANRE